MKRITLIICLVFCCFNLFAQRGFPKSAKEDKEKIMSEAYWNISNPKVQANIDKDRIEKQMLLLVYRMLRLDQK